MTRRDTVLATVMLLGIAVSWIWFVTHPTHTMLPPGSVKIASVANWQEPSLSSRPASMQKIYFWTTGGDLLYLVPNPNGSTTVVREHLMPNNTLQPLDTSSPSAATNSQFLSPTPDGNGLLYGNTDAVHNQDVTVHLVTADRRSDRALSVRWMTHTAWMPDGKQWIVSRMDGDYLNSLDGTPPRKLDTQSLSAWAPFVLGVTPQARAISVPGSDQFEPPTPFQRGNTLHYPTATLTQFDPLAPTRNPKTWNVTMPPESVRGQLLLSPQADRILWIVEKQSSGLSAWFDRMRWANNRPYSGDQALYISTVNGAGMKELFSAPTQRVRWGSTTVNVRPLSEIRWLPDGKSISFVYQDDLYIAPVD